jgi:hypothetical protein
MPVVVSSFTLISMLGSPSLMVLWRPTTHIQNVAFLTAEYVHRSLETTPTDDICSLLDGGSPFGLPGLTRYTPVPTI